MSHKHQEEMEKLDRQITELVDRYWDLLMEDTNEEEIEEAYRVLLDNNPTQKMTTAERWLTGDAVLRWKGAKTQ